MNHRRRLIRSAILYLPSALLAVHAISGCITRPQDPSATQPATAIDPATTQPSYWLARPAVAQVQAADFDTIWDAAKQTAHAYLFTLDRDDPRSGVLATAPLISRQWFEPWRPDTGTFAEAVANSMGATRRTLRFEVTRNPDDTYTATPKVLVERLAVLERRVTDVSQYRLAFAGPAKNVTARESVRLDPETEGDVPSRYWYPTGRDEAMERQVADRLRSMVERRRDTKVVAVAPTPPSPVDPAAAAAPLTADGAVSAVPGDGFVYVNVGAPEKVVPGMTFEVYDARATLPTLGAYAQDNPQSKGWIEVVSADSTGSKCRIVKAHGTTPPKQGDQIFNFVFQRGQPAHFAVAGDFTSTDRDTLTGLIWRWNGAVDPRVVPETNYLILGAPPKDAAARQAYDAAKSQAEQLKIPIVTEERFNLLIRYYDPAKR